MNSDSVRIARTDDLAAVRRLGTVCGLEDSGRGDEQIEAAWGAFAGERLVGVIVLERNVGLKTVNWMAVDDAYRRRGIAGRLYAALEREALARGITRLWVTARTPAFFLAQGFDAVDKGDERDILLGECPDCAQFRRGCEPRALKRQIDDSGPPGGPRSEGGDVARPRLSYLTDADREFIHEQTLRVLSEVGVCYGSPKLTGLLADAGANVEAEDLTAKLPWELIESCLKTVPRDIHLAGRDPAYDCWINGEGMLYTSDGAATYMLDDLTGERHEGTAADLAMMMRLYDAVPEIDFTWATITPGDVDSRVGNLEMARIAYQNSRKHLQDEVRHPDQAPVFIDMLQAIAGAPLRERPIWSATNCTIAPLQHDAEMTEAHILMARAGCPIFVLPMPQMGTTGPMSVLGTSILNMAELLSAVVLFQLAVPGCAMVSAVGSAVAEMRSGLYLSGTPEDGLINLTCIEMSKYYGLRTQGSAVSCDAKACDLQAGAEGMLTGLATALAGADVMLAFGLMDSAQTASLAKTVLDADTVNAIERFLRDDPVDEARALVDDIVAVGIGGHFLTRKSTRQFSRAGELWQPQLWHREAFDHYVDAPLVKDAWERAHELIENNEVPPLPEDVQRHVAALIADYLGGRE